MRISPRLLDQIARDVFPNQLVMANILSGPLIDLAPTLAQFCDPGGAIVLSGILADQADTVRTAYSAFFDLGPTGSQDEWVLLHGTRHA